MTLENIKTVQDWNEYVKTLDWDERARLEQSGKIVEILGRDLVYNNPPVFTSSYYKKHNIVDPCIQNTNL